MKCTKGLHEMTAENTYRDPSGRVWCRECNRIRIREYKRNRPKKRQDAAFHKTDTFTGRTAMDELLEKDPPVIVWRKKTNGVLVHVSVYDPHEDAGHNATKTKCKHGHEFTPENTLTTPTGRQCRRCKNDSTARWTANNPQVLTPEQRARKSERERLRRQQRKESECTDENLLAAGTREI